MNYYWFEEKKKRKENAGWIENKNIEKRIRKEIILIKIRKES